jgi:hypothetical protein
MARTLPDLEQLQTELPAAMQQAPCWLLWREVAVPGKKPRKVPHYANGKRRGTTDTPEDAAQLVSMEEAHAAAVAGDYSGLGFALGWDGSSYWQGIDLDQLSQHPENAAMVDSDLLPGYVERSPSGDGVHAIGYGQRFDPLKADKSHGIEAYASGRFFTVTGDAIGGELTDLSGFVATQLAPRVRPTFGGSQQEPPKESRGSLAEPREHPTHQVHISDQQIAELRSALNAIPADDYTTWISVGHALAELGPVGRQLWESWSQTSAKFQPQDALRWETFTGQRSGFQAVFAEAQRRGWANPRKAPPGPAQGAAEGQGEENAPRPRLVQTDLSNLRHAELDPVHYIIKPLTPSGHLTLLSGHGGGGKSITALVMAAHVAIGADWAGFTVTQGKVRFCSFEDSGALVRYRLSRIVEAYDLDPDRVAANLRVLDGSALDGSLAVEVNDYGIRHLRPTSLMAEVREAARDADLVILDNASDTFGGDENNRRMVRTFIRLLARELADRGAAVLLLAHLDKNAAKFGGGGNSYSGSTAWHNSARSRLALTTGEDGTVTLTQEKLNLGAKADPISLEWTEGGVLVPIDTQEAQRRAADLLTRDTKTLFLAVESYLQDQPLLKFTTSGKDTTHHLLTPHLPKGLSPDSAEARKRVAAALAQLQTQGVLRVEEYIKPDRHKGRRLVIAEPLSGVAA